MDRVKTGIPGLDDILQGGFPKGRTVLVSGACGTGKSIFCMQFLINGILQNKEPGVFVSFDEIPEKIRQDMLNFGWDLKALEEKGLLAIVDASSAKGGVPSDEEYALLPTEMDFDKVLIDILSVARKIGAKRLVIDSIPAMGMQVEKGEIRRNILKLAYVIARSGITTLLTTEVPETMSGSNGQLMPYSGKIYSRYGVEEYVADGVISLSIIEIGEELTRMLQVRKMRGGSHALQMIPLEFGKSGLILKKSENLLR